MSTYGAPMGHKITPYELDTLVAKLLIANQPSGAQRRLLTILFATLTEIQTQDYEWKSPISRHQAWFCDRSIEGDRTLPESAQGLFFTCLFPYEYARLNQI